ncbi:MAG TPA: cyclic nucleotide-binding domain-containing protein [Gammaproteobacteria bacterium]|nr:cyclic nucleotide-binding domain-containing protein [Gammaproteobacteria bacterium]
MTASISFLDLNNYQPLDTLTPDNLKEIASKLEVLELKKGDSIFQEGDRDDRLVFLHTGNADLLKNGKKLKTIEAGTPDAKLALAHIIPRNFSCVASSDAVIFKVDAELLDMMLAWGQTGSFQVEELSADEDNEDDWMTRLLQTEAFRRIPPANIQAIFTSLEDITVKPGDRVITQDEPGDYFYIIKSGRCMVTRKIPGQEKEVRLAELSPGDSFGEEALISDTKRNASVVMLTTGILSRLSKENFLELLNEPLLNQVDYTTASLKVRNGEAEWVDVRLPAEYKSAHIKHASHVPLISLRLKAKTLDPLKNYILYCDTGRRSSSASFLLNERGFKTSVLINGIKEVPTEDMEGDNI